ncbi:hypothetical protein YASMINEVIRUS_658 [Yasminevirus sp. GU-2018]|uniref:Uncharacterized protein n=1 Tax=Yasminevirus sp. GU-2018 TaxID=2420051 RepID=A0A5K0U8S7_9VIRU|nr:hypothetical protein YASMINEVIRUS_658 [Yasminevirus sp. GU-2018]
MYRKSSSSSTEIQYDDQTREAILDPIAPSGNVEQCNMCSRCMGVVVGARENDWIHVGYSLCDGTPPKCVNNLPNFNDLVSAVSSAETQKQRDEAVRNLKQQLISLNCDHFRCW